MNPQSEIRNPQFPANPQSSVPDRIQRTLARVAAFAKDSADDLEAQRRRLDGADEATLRAVVADRSEPSSARGTALAGLVALLRREPTLADLLMPLFDDPDDALAEAAIGAAPAFDKRVGPRLVVMLDDPRPGRWSAAAVALARRKDQAVVPRLAAWWLGVDQGRRHVAFAALPFLLAPDAWGDWLESAWDRDDRTEADRLGLAAALLARGDERGVPVLVDLAWRADGLASVAAAEAIEADDPAAGLELFDRILTAGEPIEVRWALVEHLARRAGLPHVWTADGLAEARSWVAARRAEVAGPIK